jgi:AcrR family transcriptional regulator
VPTGRRERKKQLVHDELTRRAFALFAERGFDRVSVEDITEAADVSRTTFFRYFPTKEDVLVQWMRAVGEETAAALLARPRDEPPLVALRAALLTLAQVYASDTERAALVEQLRRGSPTVRAAYRDKVAQWEDLLAAALAERTGSSAERDLAPRLLARLAMAAVTAAQDTWAAGEQAGDVLPLLDEALSAIDDPFRG